MDPVHVGDILGRYVVLGHEEGDAWLAFDPELARNVVLQRVEESAVARAQALAALRHAGLVQLHDVDRDADGPFVVSEHTHGTALREWLSERGHESPRIALALARALAVLHDAGIVHGDPQRVVIDAEGRARLALPLLAPVRADFDADRRGLCTALLDALPRDAPTWLRTALRRGPGGLRDTTALVAMLEVDPGARLRRIALPIAALALVVVAALAVRSWRASICSDADRALGEVWNVDARSRLASAFAATAAPFADDAIAGVDRRMSAWAEGWTHAWTEACRATRVRGEASDDELDARTACLEQRRDEAVALVELLANADDEVVREAVRAASDLQPPDECARASSRSFTEPRSARALRRRLAEARALHVAGKYDAAIAIAAEVVNDADAAGEHALLADARIVTGRSQIAVGRHDDAFASLHAAVDSAWRAHDDDGALRAWLELSFVLAEKLARPHDAELALRWAEADAQRMGGGEAIEIEVLRQRGIVAFAEGAYEQARVHHEQVLARLEHAVAPDDLRIATACNSLGNDLVRLGRLDEALPHYRRALALGERVLGSRHPDVAAYHNNLGAKLHGSGELEAALAEFELALAIRRDALGDDNAQIAESLNNIGATEYELGRNDAALAHLRDAIAIRERLVGPDHPSIGESLINVAVVSMRLGRADDAVATLDRSLAIFAARERAEHPSTATALHQRGRALVLLGRRDEARVAYARALAIREATLGSDHVDTAASRAALTELDR